MVLQPTPPTLVPQQTSCITQLSQTFEGHRKSISAVAALPSTQRMVTTSSKDKTLCLWELTTKKLLKHLVGHPSVVSGLAVSRDGRFIASCDITGGIIPWDGETGVCLVNDAQGVGFTKTKFTAQNGSTITHNGSTNRSTQNGFAIAYNGAHNGSTIAHNGSTTPQNGSTIAYNGATIAHNGATTTHNGAAIAHNGATTTHNGAAIAHNGATTTHNGAPIAHNGATTAQNGSTLVQTDESVALQLIIAHQSSEVHISLDFSADGTTLASAGDRTVKFWCTTAWKENQDAIHLDAVVHCVRYSSSGELLAIATENNIYIYNSATRQRIKTLKGHSGGTFALTWMLQGTYLLSGGGERDPTVRVWEVLKGDEIDTFRGHTDKISAIAVDDSSTIITSASSDGSVRLWPFPKSNMLEVAAGAFCVTFFSGRNDQKISQWVLPSTGLVSSKSRVKVNQKIVILDMSVAARTACITGDLSLAVEIFTQEITTNASSYVCYGNRSIVYARQCDWESALDDAIQSISIQKSLIGYISKGIALYGKGRIREASTAFDLALRLATGDSTTHHLLFLIKAIAIFNTNACEEAVMSVNDMAEVSFDADLLACKIVQIYFYAEMALAASKSNIRKKAVEYINSAIEIANSCSLQTMDFSIYTEFVVIFGWDLESLWQTIHKYKCLILSRACNIDALECYRSLLEPCDEAQKAVLIAWFAEEAKTHSATEAWARMNAEDEAKKVSSESRVAEANAKKKHAEDEAKKSSSEKKLAERTAERNSEVGSAADDATQKNIKNAARRLPKDRRCPPGYAWVPTLTVVFLFSIYFRVHFYPLKDIPYLGHSLMEPLVSHFASLELQMPWCGACPHQSVVPAIPSTGFKCTGVGHSISTEEFAKLDGSDGSDEHHQRIAYEIKLDYC